MLNYVGQLITFLAAIIAAKGGTWDKNKPGPIKLTRTGKIAICLAFVGFITSFAITYQTNRDSAQKSKQLTQTETNTKEAAERVKSLELQISIMEGQLDTYKSILKIIQTQSDRQIQRPMAEYVQLHPFDLWKAPNYIYGGSIVKFYGFRNSLLVVYGDRINISRHEVRQIAAYVSRSTFSDYPSDGYSRNSRFDDGVRDIFGERVRYQMVIPNSTDHSEVAIIGPSGQGMQWAVVNLSNEKNEGKVFLESTPRIRSVDWSWLEEKIKPDGTLIQSSSKIDTKK